MKSVQFELQTDVQLVYRYCAKIEKWTPILIIAFDYTITMDVKFLDIYMSSNLSFYAFIGILSISGSHEEKFL